MPSKTNSCFLWFTLGDFAYNLASVSMTFSTLTLIAKSRYYKERQVDRKKRQAIRW